MMLCKKCEEKLKCEEKQKDGLNRGLNTGPLTNEILNPKQELDKY
jgi:hypothetical protein